MITLMWAGLGVFAVVAAAAIIVSVWAVWRERSEAGGAGFTVDAATVMDMTMPPEVAHEPPRRSIHELPALGDAVWHQLPMTSPAHNPAPPACPGTGAEPGTAAAAAALPATPPAAAPPPLPDDDYAAAAKFADDNPGREPFELWQIDEFVERTSTYAKALQDGAP